MRIFRPLRIARFRGTDVELHPLLVLLFLLAWALPGADPLLPLLVAAVVGAVFLHELGHALAARSLGIPVEALYLGLFGGMVRLPSLPSDLRAQVVVAAAGPIANLVTAFLLAAAVRAGEAALDPGAYSRWAWLLNLGGITAAVHAVLGFFNLLPAHPLDGGRIWWAACAALAGPRWATLATVGVTAGCGLMAVGLGVALGHPMPALLGTVLLVVGPASCLAEYRTGTLAG